MPQFSHLLNGVTKNPSQRIAERIKEAYTELAKCLACGSIVSKLFFLLVFLSERHSVCVLPSSGFFLRTFGRWGWARLKSGSGMPVQVSHTSGRKPVTQVTSAASPDLRLHEARVQSWNSYLPLQANCLPQARLLL